MLKLIIGILALLTFIVSSANAESALNLAKTTQNPLGVNPEARYFTLPIVNYSNFGNNPNNLNQNLLELKPIMPFSLTKQYDFILKTILPVMHQPNSQQTDYINGLGDLNPTFFITPSKNSHLLWGLGPTFFLPTSTNSALGSKSLSIGPELVLIAMPGVWTLAISTYNAWSVTGNQSGTKVNEFSFQYFVTYNFKNGWYLTTQPDITANWLAPKSSQWTVPVGGGFGRLFLIDKQPVNFSIQAYDNVVKGSGSSNWTLQASIEFLFAKK